MISGKAEDAVYQAPSFFRDAWKGIRRWAQFDRTKVVNLGLDLQGGVHMVIDFKYNDEIKKERGMDEKTVQELILQRIRRRVNDFQTKEPVIQAMGTNQIQIQLPGEKDVDGAIALIKQTALLTFNVVSGPDEMAKALQAIEANSQFKGKFIQFLQKPNGRNPWFTFPPDQVARIKPLADEINKTPKLMPEGKMLAISQPPNPADEQIYHLYMMDAKPLMTGENLRMARAAPDEEHPGKWQIYFSFNSQGAQLFGAATEKNIGKPMGIVLDGVVCSAPTIQSKIGRDGRITGNFTGQQATDLSIALNSGSMPVPIHVAYTGVVGPSLGADSIRRGVEASVAGIGIVLLFMALYYRFGGLIADVALFLNGFILLALFAYFNLTLTLPGIAGFVLTLGMGVDANVLIFERVREELRNGKSLIASIELGYQRATVTIIDSHVTTVIAALVLLQFGTGPVQGFGIALVLGIATSLFTALVVTKAIFDWINRNKWLTKLTMMSAIKHDTKIPFIEWRNKAFAISIISAIIGLAVFFGRGYENNFGVDFAGGTSMIVTLNSDNPIHVDQVREKMNTGDFPNAVIQEYGEGTSATAKNEFAIRTSEKEESTTAETDKADIQTRIRQALAPLTGDSIDNVVLKNVQMVGTSIGNQLKIDAIKAVMFGFIFQIAYLWFRFNLTWGVMGVVALFHDALFAVCMLAIFGRHIDMNVIAAVLTIIGYSINDTVVVYDRIRENLKLYAGRGLNLGQIIDMAINQTLSRTLLTSFCTLLTVIMLLIFGGSVLRDFSICLTVGVISGTYSSIFVASTLAYVSGRPGGASAKPKPAEQARIATIANGPRANRSQRKRPHRTRQW